MHPRSVEKIQALRHGPAQWLFDGWSHFYDLPLIQRATYRPVHNAVLQALTQTGCRRVLDLGCGTGHLAVRIKQALPDADITACDFSAGMLGRAAARSNVVRWVQTDATRLPFHDGAFDVVTSTEAFHWFPDQAATLAECYRVLVPGGRLLLALANPPIAVVSELVYAGSWLVGQPFYWPTTGKVRRWIEAAGFQVEDQRRIFRFPGLLLLPVLTQAVRPSRSHAHRPHR
jgi:SAM-dependent methyltransferase